VHKMSDPEHLKDEAAAVLNQYIERGRGAEGSVHVYSDSGAKYKEYMIALRYIGPSKTAEIVAELLKENFAARVLDVGAGTGLVADELLKLGYNNFDAVDASEGMLEVAREKNIYGKIVCQFVGTEKMPFDEDSYDVALTCGAVQENHLPLEAIVDIIRVVKPGGYLVNVFRAEAANAPWYKEGLETFLSTLEKKGVLKQERREIFPDFVTGKDGMALVHKVL
jgi:ubiquinone/menaquinone biosynthesis C-methylase UbiE